MKTLTTRIAYTSPIKLDIGCGMYKKEGFTGLDMLDFGQDIVWDVRNGIPLPDESVVEFYCSHFIEHLTRAELEPFAEELRRVITQDCVCTFAVPHTETVGAYDYAHRSWWNEHAMRGFFPSAGFDILDMKNTNGNLVVVCKKNR